MKRKVEILDIGCIDEEFQIKSGCLRRKSLDFIREKKKKLSKLNEISRCTTVKLRNNKKKRKNTISGIFH
mgnify:CR=1 FL=1